MDRASGTSSRFVPPGAGTAFRHPDDEDDLLGSYTGPPPIVVPPVEPPPTPPPSPLLNWKWAAVAGGVMLVAIAVIAVLAFQLGSNNSSTTASPAAASTTATTTPTSLPVTQVFQTVAPSVVLVTTAKGSLGSGVIVTATGTILTANHVISDGSAVTVVFSDGTKSTAAVATSSKSTDTATLTPATLPEVVVPATIGGSTAVGADVVAIGNPLGFVDSTTSGIVSGLDRTANTKAGKFSGLIQFDAAVNPGSSGGPLLDAKGLVIGIVVSIADPGEDDAFAGIGFAVPIAGALGGGAGSGPGDGPQI